MATRVGLSKESVIQKATALADVVGLEGLTLGMLAEHLGVRPPTLYHYLPDGLAGLRRELALQSLHDQVEQLGRAIMGKAGREALWSLAETFRNYIKAHPGLYAATTMHSITQEDAEIEALRQAVYDVVFRALAAYHLSEDTTIHFIRMLRILVHGTATLELGSGFGLPQSVDETFQRMFTIYLDALDTQTQGTEPARSHG